MPEGNAVGFILAIILPTASLPFLANPRGVLVHIAGFVSIYLLPGDVVYRMLDNIKRLPNIMLVFVVALRAGLLASTPLRIAKAIFAAWGKDVLDCTVSDHIAILIVILGCSVAIASGLDIMRHVESLIGKRVTPPAGLCDVNCVADHYQITHTAWMMGLAYILTVVPFGGEALIGKPMVLVTIYYYVLAARFMFKIIFPRHTALIFGPINAIFRKIFLAYMKMCNLITFKLDQMARKKAEELSKKAASKEPAGKKK
ncbi:hypothetical protein ADUPG1_005948 [Aduncisulcus paluster]|uniref:Uncharacterized protein n=1 Tax=Aduncisulcus paluster TaxID=2918883 RepID=A0ABQ5KG80_9EUKA|nr:hypothetical protein ADUPG1_005948 [Aduncisulcus paluster]